ncbi:MAG: hypothetical protein IPK85_17160 [Gemmatimonadetes bacterium]|nr:hypothetical protein [Gemmatimonadota bacterium]
MTGSPEGTMDVLHQLLAERTRYETWITQLEERRATAPGHVLERVRSDYATRLDQVVTQLRGRAVELESTAATLRSRLGALATEEETRRDERAETELRAAVGEYSEDEARSTFERCDASISSLVAQRDALGAELAKLQEVLVLVVAREPEPVAPEPVAPEPEPAAEAPPSALEVSQVTAVMSEPDPAGDAPVAAAAEPTTPSAAAELEFLRSLVSAPAPELGSPDGQEYVAPPVLAAPRRQPTPLSATAIRDPLRSALGETGAATASAMNFLKEAPAEQVKTLKCQECSTMNYATEWYCERCGGELAAM